jgi:hypothetical protein
VFTWQKLFYYLCCILFGLLLFHNVAIIIAFVIQILAWIQKQGGTMKEYGKQMKQKGVSHIYFVHGTWAGDSPLGFLSRIPNSPFKWQLRKIVKINVDKTMGDLGNYTESYRDDFQESIGVNIPCDRINWDSGNYHSARVRGAIILIKEVASNIKNPPENERILLIGHSHAGQLFALLTTFLEEEELSVIETNEKMSKMMQLVKVVGLDKSIYDDIDHLKEDLKKIDKVFLDIVTFGTPPRYQWGKPKRKGVEANYRLLNIINHHHEPVSILGLLNTKDGDYVQQWGVGKTDLYDIKNIKIEEIIGEEQYYFSAESVLKGDKRRIPKYGETLLIDYGDEGKRATETLLGHGAYTCKEKMLFNTVLIVEKFYKG